MSQPKTLITVLFLLCVVLISHESAFAQDSLTIKTFQGIADKKVCFSRAIEVRMNGIGRIHYNLNNQKPDTCDLVYQKPILISETSVLRAGIFHHGNLLKETCCQFTRIPMIEHIESSVKTKTKQGSASLLCLFDTLAGEPVVFGSDSVLLSISLGIHRTLHSIQIITPVNQENLQIKVAINRLKSDNKEFKPLVLLENELNNRYIYDTITKESRWVHISIKNICDNEQNLLKSVSVKQIKMDIRDE